ncbi:hypothetical protein ACFOEX_10025 [Camelimonas abortus]|uniref:PXPV repeat-containing protein n=1 Tax=Camelimonas abortus TaxID=1017184 RepID=A0ABV7LHS0_9HYPH
MRPLLCAFFMLAAFAAGAALAAPAASAAAWPRPPLLQPAGFVCGLYGCYYRRPPRHRDWRMQRRGGRRHMLRRDPPPGAHGAPPGHGRHYHNN